MTLSDHYQAALKADESHPLLEELDAEIHEPMTPVSLRKPSAAYVILLVSQDAGVPMAVARGWLAKMNFEDAIV